MHRPDVDDPELKRELERRLDLIEDPAYDDPARRDLPAGDIVGLLGLVVVIVVLSYLVLY
jgi:hypothetical protein